MVIKEAKFKVQQDNLDQALTLIKTFVLQVNEKEPDTLSYNSYQSESDPTRFVHIMQFKDEVAENYHRNTEYVKAFVSGLYPICDEEPTFKNLREV